MKTSRLSTALRVAVDPDDVLFSGSRATPGDFDEYDPLLNGHSVTEPVAAAAAATTAAQAYAAPVDAVMPSAPVRRRNPLFSSLRLTGRLRQAFTRRSRLSRLNLKATSPCSRNSGSSLISRRSLRMNRKPHYQQPVSQPYQEYVPEPVEPVQPYVAAAA
jgi:S-DNA-T family DNA segregation ATPase FtsK/SpoIIIE